MDLATEALETIRELRRKGVTIQIMNWRDYIQNKAAEIYQRRCNSIDLFPALIIDDCMLQAQDCFARDKRNGLIDEYNCYIGE